MALTMASLPRPFPTPLLALGRPGTSHPAQPMPFPINKKTPRSWGSVFHQAEREGFEPSIPFRIRVFETRALGQLCDLSKPKLSIAQAEKAGKNVVAWCVVRIP